MEKQSKIKIKFHGGGHSPKESPKWYFACFKMQVKLEKGLYCILLYNI